MVDRAEFNRVTTRAARFFVAAVEGIRVGIGPTLPEGPPGALRLAVRLLELNELDPLSPATRWGDIAERSRAIDAGLLRDDEPRLMLHALPAVDPQWLPPVVTELRAAVDELSRAAIDDPLGTLYESALGCARPDGDAARERPTQRRASRRRSAGAFYTPVALIDHLIACALDPALPTGDLAGWRDALPRVCDPACGSGRFLVAAAKRVAAWLAEHAPGGAERATRFAVSSCVFGVDIDPTAVELTRFRLWRLASGDDSVADVLKQRCRVGDALLGAAVDPTLTGEAAALWCERAAGGPVRGLFHWQDEFPAVFQRTSPTRSGFDVVLGNPPFLAQLSSRTSRTPQAARIVDAWSGGAVRRYADSSAAFVVRAVQLAKPGGRVALVQPLSLLASQDARGARDWIAMRAALEHLWLGTTPVFAGADVLTCAPVLLAGAASVGVVGRSRGVPVEPLQAAPATRDELRHGSAWSFLLADAIGVPRVTLAASRTLADFAAATADFRDQYYGLKGLLVDRPDAADERFPPLITSGLIDPAECRWGRSPTRVLKQTWSAPRVDRAAMDASGTLGAWMSARLVPKLLVATQTRVIEAVADAAGVLLPSTPVLTVVPHDQTNLWRVGAVLLSPVASAVALREVAGSARSGDTIKLAARQVLALPAPRDDAMWDRAADAFRRANAATDLAERREWLRAGAADSIRAFGVPAGDAEALLAWWWDRLPRRVRLV